MFTGVDLFHSPYHPIPDAIATGRRRIGKVLTVYDLIPILFAQYFDSPAVAQMLRRGVASLGNDGVALCISEATKRDLCQHFGLPADRAVVTHLAASASFGPVSDAARLAAVRARYHIPEEPYLLSLCTLEPRKNIAHSIRCFLRLVEQDHIRDLNLVLVGTKGWNYDQIFAALAANPRHRDRVVVTGFVADGDLAPLYSGAWAFVYPSHYEGFGLPVLEAMQCGIPVITSNTSSLPEVVGDAGIMLAPTDADGLCAAMGRLYRDSEYRAALSAKSLARAAHFSWDRCIASTLAAYQLAQVQIRS
jgi:glycosyltransferase involved in cell wall biosynthesis